MNLTALYLALRGDLQRYHVRAQAVRFAAGVAATLAVDYGTSGSAWPAKTLVTAGVSAVWITLRQMYPTIPWSAVQARFHAIPAPPAERPPPS